MGNPAHLRGVLFGSVAISERSLAFPLPDEQCFSAGPALVFYGREGSLFARQVVRWLQIWSVGGASRSLWGKVQEEARSLEKSRSNRYKHSAGDQSRAVSVPRRKRFPSTAINNTINSTWMAVVQHILSRTSSFSSLFFALLSLSHKKSVSERGGQTL